MRFCGVEVIAKSILTNAPCLVVYTNTIFEIDRVELRGEKFSGVDDLIGTLDGKHELPIAEHWNQFAQCTVLGKVVLGEELGRGFVR